MEQLSRDVFNRLTVRELDTRDAGVTRVRRCRGKSARAYRSTPAGAIRCGSTRPTARRLRCRTQPFDRGGGQGQPVAAPPDRHRRRVRHEKRNVLNPNSVDPFVKSQIGRQRSRGAEAELTYVRPDDLYVTAAYTYVDATIRNDQDRTLIGKPLSNVPRHAGSLFALKTVGRLGVGGGITYVGTRAGDPFGTSYRLPAYTIARATLSYAVTPRV